MSIPACLSTPYGTANEGSVKIPYARSISYRVSRTLRPRISNQFPVDFPPSIGRNQAQNGCGRISAGPGWAGARVGPGFSKLTARHYEPQTAGSANNRMGITLCLMGIFVEARCHLQRALDFYAMGQENSAATAPFRSSNALLFLGVTLWVLAYPEQAVAASAKALVDARVSGHAVAIGIALFHLASPKPPQSTQAVTRLRTPQGRGCRASQQSSPPRRNLVALYAFGKRAHGRVPEPDPSFEAPIRLKTVVIARTVRSLFLKRSDPSQPRRTTRPPIRHEQRRRAAAQAYMAIAPPSTWISEPVM
jgi:hypothetical protein